MITEHDEAAEFYGYAREVWDVFAGRAGWRGRINYADAIQSAAAHCWAVREKHDPKLSSRRSFFTLCARRCITEINRKLRVQKRQARVLSLDVPVIDGGAELGATIPAPGPGPDELAEHNDEVANLMEALNDLPPREWYAIWEHQLRGHTLERIGEELGVTREAVRQVEAKGLRRLTATLTRARIQP